MKRYKNIILICCIIVCSIMLIFSYSKSETTSNILLASAEKSIDIADEEEIDSEDLKVGDIYIPSKNKEVQIVDGHIESKNEKSKSIDEYFLFEFESKGTIVYAEPDEELTDNYFYFE